MGADVAVTLAEAISEFNRPYENRARAALIHKIDQQTAEAVATALARESLALMAHLPAETTSTQAVCYFAAVIGQESRFDPQAINMNLTVAEAPLAFLSPAWETFSYHLERNSPLLAKGDYGVAMFKLKYLMAAADAKGCTELRTPPQVIQSCSFNPAWALRLSARRYANLLRWAAMNFVGEDVRWVATGAYNQGQRGFREAYFDNTKPAWAAAQKHIARVKGHYESFLNRLTTSTEVT